MAAALDGALGELPKGCIRMSALSPLRLLGKLGAASRTEAVSLGIRRGLVLL